MKRKGKRGKTIFLTKKKLGGKEENKMELHIRGGW